MIGRSDMSRSKAARFNALTEVGPTTTMGKLLRSFWQPVALADSVPKGSARGLQLLGEEFTLYRGESGLPYLIGGRCAHRCTVLHTGWVQDDQIRCMYHGWRYDGTGQCTEMPAENHAKLQNVQIAGYPVHEYRGLIFAYLGDGPPPAFELPRKAALEDPGRHVFCVPPVIWDTNWFQLIENSLDASHVSFVHVWGRVDRFGEEITTAIPQLSYTETSAGIQQVAKRSETNVRVSDWTFPNNNHIIVPGPGPNDPWIDLFPWVVPIDEGHMIRFVLGSFPKSDAKTTARITREYLVDYTPVDHVHDLFTRHRLPKLNTQQLTSTQDYVAARGQGQIVNRLNERLGQSDTGIAMLRKIFWRELAAMRAGRPTKQWSRLNEAPPMPTPVRRTANA